MQSFHDTTNITLKKYYSEPNFIDYTTQPKSDKTYPHFYRRFHLEDYPQLQFISNFGKATYHKKYGNDEVILRTNPSAGGLYPCEVYIQIRKVKGILSGIYHYEPLSNQLVLIHELSNDGLEYYFESPHEAQQFIFLVSCAHFRSTWKYEQRAIRYLLLDTGHQLSAIQTALEINNTLGTLSFDFDKKAINKLFGFEGHEHFFAALLVPLQKEITVKPLRQSLPYVAACDYQYKEPFVESFYEKSLLPSASSHETHNFFEAYTKSEIQQMIDNRRSARAFKKGSISKEIFDAICKEVFEFAQTLGIEIFYINNNIEAISLGLYKNESCLKKGDFAQKAQDLALNQALASKSSATLFFTASKEQDCLKSTIFSAYLAHIIYLKASHFNIRCSAVGAYFDLECQSFLATKNNILYLLCLGK